MMLKTFSVFYIVVFFCASTSSPRRTYAQASLQRMVKISNANGNYLTMQTGLGTQSFTLTLPSAINPSLTTGSVLYGLGSGTLNWSNTTGTIDGWLLALKTSGGNLIPTWIDPSTFGNFWSLPGNAAASAWNGTTGSFLGTTNTQPLVLATTNTVTSQPIEFYTNNVEQMRLSSAGNLGIGTTTPAKTLEVAGTAGTPNVRLGSLKSATTSTTGSIVYADLANGDLNALAAPGTSGQFLTSTSGGTSSWSSAPMLVTGGTIGLYSGNNAVTTEFCSPMGQQGNTAGNNDKVGQTRILIPKSGTVKNLYVSLSTDPGNTNTRAFTITKNGAAQIVTCIVTGNAGGTSLTASDITHSFTVNAGDEVSLRIVSTLHGANFPVTNADWGFEIDTP